MSEFDKYAHKVYKESYREIMREGIMEMDLSDDDKCDTLKLIESMDDVERLESFFDTLNEGKFFKSSQEKNKATRQSLRQKAAGIYQNVRGTTANIERTTNHIEKGAKYVKAGVLVAVAAFVGGIISKSMKAYKTYKHSHCADLRGPQLKVCKLKAVDVAVKGLNKYKSDCSKTKDPEKCKKKIDQGISKLMKDKQKLMSSK